MLTIGICDDELTITKKLKKYVDDYFISNNISTVVKEYNRTQELMEDITSLSIIFLDIEIGKENGINVAKEIINSYKNTHIIFVSNYESYLIDAFGVHAFDYIVKPVSYENVKKVLDDLFEMHSKLLEKSITTHFRTKIRDINISINDIYYFELNYRKVYIVTKDKKIRIIHEFKSIKQDFIKYGFFSPHRNFMINLSKVAKFKGYDINMKNGALIPISQKKSVEFRKVFNMFINGYNL
ncbi:MAG: LytTR family DNA-binding domain-containing protein [Bacilli bacterium]